MKAWKLYLSDCIRGMADLDGESVDLVFADPPFNIGFDYSGYDHSRSREDYLGFTHDWMAQVNRVLKDDGTFWFAIGDDHAADLVHVAKSLGLTQRNWVIWYYTFGVNCTKKFNRSHTHLLYFTKHAKRFTFNAGAIKVPSARQIIYNDPRAAKGGKVPDDTWILRPQDAPEAFQPNHDTWHVPRVCGTFRERQGWHGCQMPEAILDRIVSVSSNPGDLVVDPFVGSGTTGVVCVRRGRKFIGYEISRRYFKSAARRIREARARGRAG